MDHWNIRKLVREEIYKESDYELLNEFFGKIKGAAQGAVQGFSKPTDSKMTKTMDSFQNDANAIADADENVNKMKKMFKNMTGFDYDDLSLNKKRVLKDISTALPSEINKQGTLRKHLIDKWNKNYDEMISDYNKN